MRSIYLLVLLATLPLHAGWVPALVDGRVRPVELTAENRDTLDVLPGRHEWYPLSAEENLSTYSDAFVEQVRAASTETAANLLRERYPHTFRLRVEALYLKVPWTALLIAAYGLALLFCWWRPFPFLLGAFLLNTLMLGMRCYILARPPVSNMAETLLWVPWVAAGLALLLRQKLVMGAAAVGGVAMAILTTQLSAGLDNVQPVLNSQLWLSTHVLMVVGSYGVFLLASILAHVYLWKPRERLTAPILQLLYIGTGMLVTGTILGGVWAAQSWGRFWDWDPKESWAFISALLFITQIHVFKWRVWGPFGLALGTALGFWAISFTWYGVNYVLGTGLHSYGFGSGGAGIYWLFLAADGLLIAGCALRSRLSAH